MAEAMTVETILEADWQMKRFWTRVRFPLRTKKGQWSDVDVLAYHPETRHLVIAESKVGGPKRNVYAYTAYTRAKYGDFLKYDAGHYFGFLRHISLIRKDGVVFDHFRSMVRKLTVQLVSNYYIADEVKADAERSVRARIIKTVPRGIKLDVKLETTLDVILRILTEEGVALQGRRYGHPVIDLARELNRYMRPNVRYAGRGNAAAEGVKEALAKQILSSFGQHLDALPHNRLQLRAARTRPRD